jgi:hypothetical protein
MKYPASHLTPFVAVIPAPIAFFYPPLLATPSHSETVRCRCFNRLRTLKLSCASFSHRDPLFSIVCALFDKNTRGGIPLHLHASQVTSHTSPSASCAETQKRPPVSPFPAALTNSLSRKSFACHSYANTRDVCATPPKILRLRPRVLLSVPAGPLWQNSLSLSRAIVSHNP